MPNISEVTEQVNRAGPSATGGETKAAWLLELDGQLYRETILQHQFAGEREARGPVTICPTHNRTKITYNRVMGSNLCPVCGWIDLPDFPKTLPEDGDRPLLVETLYDGLYSLYLVNKIDSYNQEANNYNSSTLAYNTTLDGWWGRHRRRYLPIGGGDLIGPL